MNESTAEHLKRAWAGDSELQLLIFGSSLRPEGLARDLDVVVLYQSFASLQEFLARLDVDDRGATIDLTLLTPEEAVSSDFLIRSGAVEFDRWENF